MINAGKIAKTLTHNLQFMKPLLMPIMVCLFLSCQTTESKHETKKPDSLSVFKDSVEKKEIKKFFVLTKWSTTDREKALSHIPKQQKQLMSLWNKGIVENIYYPPKGKIEADKPLALIAFIINGTSEKEVRTTLDTTDIVKSNLASYTLIPVGYNVFNRNEEALKLVSIEKTYAVLLAFLVEKDKLNSKIIGEQALLNSKLHEQGILENAYINLNFLAADSTGTQPAIFFINAKNEKDAKILLDKMPLVTSKQATYALHNVGRFLVGKSK